MQCSAWDCAGFCQGEHAMGGGEAVQTLAEVREEGRAGAAGGDAGGPDSSQPPEQPISFHTEKRCALTEEKIAKELAEHLIKKAGMEVRTSGARNRGNPGGKTRYVRCSTCEKSLASISKGQLNFLSPGTHQDSCSNEKVTVSIIRELVNTKLGGIFSGSQGTREGTRAQGRQPGHVGGPEGRGTSVGKRKHQESNSSQKKAASDFSPESPLYLSAVEIEPERLSSHVRGQGGIHGVLQTLYANQAEEMVRKVYELLCKHILPLQKSPNFLGQIICQSWGRSFATVPSSLSSYARQFKPDSEKGEIRLFVEHQPISDDPCTLNMEVPGGWVFGSAALDSSLGWTVVFATEGGLRVGNTINGTCKDLIKSHNGAVSCVASTRASPRVTPRGAELVVSGGDDGTVRIWTAHQDGMLRGPLATEAPLGVDPDKVDSRPENFSGTRVAHRFWVKQEGAVTAVAARCVGDDVEVVAGLNGGVIKGYKCSKDTEGRWTMVASVNNWPAHNVRVVALEVVSKGDLGFLVVSADDEGLVRCSTLGNGTTESMWQVKHGGRVNDLCVSISRQEVCAIGDDTRASKWSLDTGDALGEMKHTRQLICGAYDESGDILAVGCEDGALCVWNLKTNVSAGPYHYHSIGLIFSVLWLPCGGVLTTSIDFRAIRLSGMVKRTQPTDIPFLREGPATQPDQEPDQELLSHPCGVQTICTRDTLVAWGGAGGRASVGCKNVNTSYWSDGQHCVHTNKEEGSVYDCAFSPDGHFLALVSWTGILPPCGNGSLTVHRVGHRYPVVACEKWDEGLVSVAFFPNDQNLLALASIVNQVVLVEWSERGITKLANLITGHDLGKAVRCVAFSRDGVWLASASDDSTVTIWTLENFVRGSRQTREKVQSRLRGHAGFVRECVWSPARILAGGHEMLATAGADTTIRVWDINKEQSQLIRVLEWHSSITWAVSFSSDGLLLASCDNHGLVLLTAVDTWQEVGLFDAKTGTRAVAVWNNEKLVVGKPDGGVTVLLLSRGRCAMDSAQQAESGPAGGGSVAEVEDQVEGSETGLSDILSL